MLVVGAEVLSAIYQHSDTSIESMIYKALFGDSASAAVVTDTPLGPGLAIDDTFEYVLADSLDRQRGRIDVDGIHFDSSKKALSAAAEVLPHFKDWYGPTETPDFAVIHPGSPRIISDTTDALGLTAHDARHSTDTLADEGNLGGVSVLRVLERTHGDPPPTAPAASWSPSDPASPPRRCAVTGRHDQALPLTMAIGSST
ncbi:hypothetical protein ACFQ0X_04905 [Streptomyces rectiviolaceus]|uniref:hypothetical protein n=1 Tax=Streptomyces rectiviolaceus TaxID=332591 RepID=UPI0036350762